MILAITKTKRIVSYKAASVASFVLLLIVGLPNSGINGEGNFVAGLDGNQEMPPVNTSAIGYVNFVLNSDRVSYVLNVTNIHNVTNADLHFGSQGKNGSIVATLFEPQSPTGMINGTLSKGNITSDNLQGPIKDKQVSDLIDLMQRGNIYVNIRTVTNPGGEIRGQVGYEGIDETGTTLGEMNLPPPILEAD